MLTISMKMLEITGGKTYAQYAAGVIPSVAIVRLLGEGCF